MKIQLLGHAAFYIEAAGARIVMDPYGPGCGTYDPVGVVADIVTLSHDDEPVFHSYVEGVKGDPEIVHGLELFEKPVAAHGITFQAVKTYERPDRAKPIAMVHFEAEGIHLCHMGDVGHALEDAMMGPIMNCDVLLALAGGRPTIALADLKKAIDRIGPRLVIPMHFYTPKINLQIQPVEALLELIPAERTRRISGSSVEVTAQTLPEETEVWVLQPGR